jgi:hypothetical protein
MSQATATSAESNVGLAEYIRIGSAVTLFSGALFWVTRTNTDPAPPERLITPMLALVGLTSLVWLVMVVIRNGSILRGITSPAYYVAYSTKHPPDWVERPARTFNNLMQVPVLFYVVSLLMLITRRVDGAQVTLAWIFVSVRALHALIYIGWNYVPYRFGAWISGCITLGVLWFRFALLG